MKTYIYTAENPGGAELAGGFGFTAAGLWRGGALPPGAAGLMLDDREPPSPRGLEAARAALRAWSGLVVLDFERPPDAWAEQLTRGLDPARVLLPPAFARLPHGAVLIGPWMGGGSFARWLTQQRERYGAVVLDGLPLRTAARPGGARTRWTGPLPDAGFPCPGAGCLHRRLEDGTLLFWDTEQTLRSRIEAAGVPVIVFEADWKRLPRQNIFSKTG